MVTVLEAKKFARIKAFKATGLVLTILVLLLLIGETSGDFANGILFFIDAIANIHTIIIMTILFGLTYLFAGRAGEEVIIEKQNILIISLKYVILLSLAITIYVIFIGLLRIKDFSFNGVKNISSTYFLPMFSKTGISLLVVWFWATSKMKDVKS